MLYALSNIVQQNTSLRIYITTRRGCLTRFGCP